MAEMRHLNDTAGLPVVLWDVALNMTGQTCPVTGNPDLYGLGIRIGIYVQMIAVQLSSLTSAVLDIDDTLGQGTVLFILSVGTVLWQQIKSHAIEAVEVAPVITLLVSQLAVCRVPWWRSQLTMLIYLAELIALNALDLWFWFHGMEEMPRSCHHDWAWFFAKVSIWGWFRKFRQATSILAAIPSFLGALTYLGVIVYYLVTMPKALLKGEVLDDEARSNNIGFSLNVFVIIGMVAYVEMALKWNHITDVHSLTATGQFMPLFISLAQLIAVIYQLMKLGVHLIADDESLTRVDSDDDDPPCRHGEAGVTNFPMNALQAPPQQQGITTTHTW